MWRLLRKSLLLLLTAVLGIVVGVLIRFAFGQSLQWEKPAAVSAKPWAQTGAKPVTIEKSAPPPVSLAVSPAVEELRILAAGDSAALEQMLDQAWEGQLDGRSLGPGFNRLVERLISLDPVRAMAWAKQHLFGRSGTRFVFDRWLAQDRTAAETWAAANDPALLKAAYQSPPPLSDDELVKLFASDPAALDARMKSDSNLLSRLAKLRTAQDPAAALEWAMSAKSAARRSESMRSVFSEWVKRDPAAAAEAWKSLPKGEAAKQSFQDITNALPKDQALAWLRSLEQTEMVCAALAQRLPDGPERDAMKASLPAGATPSSSLTSDQFNAALESGPSPQTFAALAEAAKAGLYGDEKIASVLFARDPDGTIAALEKLPDGGFKSTAMKNLTDWIADRPESEAMQRFAELPPGPVRDTTAEKLAERLTKTSPEQALALLQKESAGARGRALPEVMTAMFNRDPAAARAQWEVLPEADREAAGKELAERLSWVPTPETMALFTALPDVPADTYKEAAESWVTRSPEQASTWVNQLPAGDQRDAAVGSMVRALTMNDWDPERAAVWAGTIDDAEQRAKSLRTTFELWTLRDPAAAGAARQLLSPEDQQSLTTP